MSVAASGSVTRWRRLPTAECRSGRHSATAHPPSTISLGDDHFLSVEFLTHPGRRRSCKEGAPSEMAGSATRPAPTACDPTSSSALSQVVWSPGYSSSVTSSPALVSRNSNKRAASRLLMIPSCNKQRTRDANAGIEAAARILVTWASAKASAGVNAKLQLLTSGFAWSG